MLEKIIVDADLCIKLGGSSKYKYLYDILPLIAEEIYMHTCAHGEVMIPPSAVSQLKDLISEGKVVLVNESGLDSQVRAIYDAAYHNLAKVMIDPTRPNKNKGEMCSLAYAKATRIPVFATDEKNLQPIIDKRLNTGMDDISCIRIVDIITEARNGKIAVTRKVARALWLITGKQKELFDCKVWPKVSENT